MLSNFLLSVMLKCDLLNNVKSVGNFLTVTNTNITTVHFSQIEEKLLLNVGFKNLCGKIAPKIFNLCFMKC